MKTKDGKEVKVPKWLQAGRGADYDPIAERNFKLRGQSFGAASAVKKIDPAEYQKNKGRPN